MLTQAGLSLHWQQQPRVSPAALWRQNPGEEECRGHLSQVRLSFPPPTHPQNPQQLQLPWKGISRFGTFPAPTMAQEWNPIAVLIPEPSHSINTMGFIPIQPLQNRSTSSPFLSLRFLQVFPLSRSQTQHYNQPKSQNSCCPCILQGILEHHSCIPLHKEGKTGTPKSGNQLEPQNTNKPLK